MKLTKYESIHLWVARNRGDAAALAKKFGVTRAFINDVMYGRRNSRDNRIEKALAVAGVPGFEAFAKAARP